MPNVTRKVRIKEPLGSKFEDDCKAGSLERRVKSFCSEQGLFADSVFTQIKFRILQQ